MKYIESKNGYFYQIKNNIKTRIPKDEYLNKLKRGGANNKEDKSGGGGGGGGRGGGGNELSKELKDQLTKIFKMYKSIESVIKHEIELYNKVGIEMINYTPLILDEICKIKLFMTNYTKNIDNINSQLKNIINAYINLIIPFIKDCKVSYDKDILIDLKFNLIKKIHRINVHVKDMTEQKETSMRITNFINKYGENYGLTPEEIKKFKNIN